ncbi:uncharacterized protein LOC129771679 isoform X1 [Toxorhynchites rutilus septentrionalis]|uniref:uncharacterized protein LOC129771679 isoform X1 n=1 Tax=Toxorhynchites rutilus septentrionalis TaxID=329112 RepID=UPI0024786E5C|nr:uncharacterized protein LOC129771679 isoform X1 [Toxorhynchites rutilus septentrionalis]XP_055631552.1 uncharacterized protein LOC129771679 isoform X1 [Toxorhynchites rutilus septentrionalis]XP_055631553.1 uncharacterized protein LOC129771679 isoform X1 [Toxorhynchites rutilus septentrionalis]XP_055631554.1 uncharacterized protein LOC129771679 isoform X1 [Toxorhynchites rutilus septentrionalis]XP_055631555.1 uncharacterized protein LOC129771679 isoform X1 [Toxorhynchites rutilus septentriona
MPKILLGLPHSFLISGRETRSGKFNEPVAQNTKLGWVLFGQTNEHKKLKGHVLMNNETDSSDYFNKMMENYFSLEDFGIKAHVKSLMSNDEKRSIDIMNSTLKYQEGIYEIGLLWKQDDVQFPNSYQSAMNRLCGQEARMRKNQKLRKWYVEKIKEYETKGYARKLTPTEQQQRDPKIFYLPHFTVVNLNKQPIKPRLVFDAAAKVKGESLNTKLLSGPDATTSLFGVLIRFREGKFAITGDIKEMFHQVKIRKEDQNAQRFLFRENFDEDPDVYVMQVMTFGATCSPACAQFVKNTNAEKFKESQAVKAIQNNHYVDDYLDSFDDLSEASKIVNEVITIHKYGHFNIRNFISNSNELLGQIPEENRTEVKEDLLGNSKESYEKVLGVYWDTKKDCIHYKVDIPVTQEFTKRKLLSQSMSVYDPLGLLSHITIQSRILMQELWKSGITWDEQLNPALKKNWENWHAKLEEARAIRIPRSYANSSHPKERELHVFVDASENAYAAAVYLRSVYESHIDVNFMAAKARVAPTKILSIPRLELQAAVLGSRLAKTVKDELRLSIDRVVFWSDSKTVLAWIRSEPRKYKQFVALRIGEILETTYVNQWKWVNSRNNPADEATKLSNNNSIWFTGPQFLYDNEENWPNEVQRSDTDEELRPLHIIKSKEFSGLKSIHINWCSDFVRLKRSVAITFKYIDWLKSKCRNQSFNKNIDKEDLDYAELVLMHKAQWESYSKEMELLQNKMKIHKGSEIRTLSPEICTDGIMRSKGRIENANCLPTSARTPIILSYKHYVSTLILRHYHEKYRHENMETAIAAVRQKFWITNVRVAIKTVRRNCQFCKNMSAEPIPPMMAALPPSRTIPYCKPFTYTGADYRALATHTCRACVGHTNVC